MIEKVKQYPGQVVPIVSPNYLSEFKSTTQLDDNYLYFYKNISKEENRYSVSGIINEEELFVKKLLEAGAIIKNNDLKLPEYKSWADISPGIKFHLSTNNYCLDYVPRNQFNVKEPPSPFFHCKVHEAGTHQATYKIHDHIKQELSCILERIISDKDLFFLNNPVEGAEPLFDVSFKDHNTNTHKKYQCGYQDLFSIINSEVIYNDCYEWEELYAYLKIIKSTLKSNCEKVKTFILFPNSKNSTVMTIKSSKKIIRQNKNSFEKVDANVYRRTSTVSFNKIREVIEKIYSQSSLGPINVYKSQNKNLTFLRLFKDSLSKNLHSPLTGEEEIIVDQIIQEMAFTTRALKGSLKFEPSKQILVENLAPYSERGKLKVSFFRSKDLPIVLKSLAYLGVISSYDQPEKKIGLVNSRCEISQKKPFKLPLSHSIIHGMTGVSSPDKAYERLKQMTKQEGILSYRERRRLGIENHTMSPIGDMASSLDWAVPATINKFPSYGNYIFFIIHPNSLHRKHLFFAPTDFGGGQSRFGSYNDYAKSLGQKSFFDPPTREQKDSHLKNIPDMELNEVWFKQSIAWHEITHVLVNKWDGLDQKVKKLLNQNMHTRHIEVIGFVNDGFSTDINKPYPSTELKLILTNISSNLPLGFNVFNNISRLTFKFKEKKAKKTMEEKILEKKKLDSDFESYKSLMQELISGKY